MIDLSDKNKKIHFIGVGGVSMSALAMYLKNKGFTVSGSDISIQDDTFLSRLGIKVYRKHDKENIKNCDVVVYTSAISEDNEEYKKAKEIGLPLIKRSILLGRIISQYKNSIGVSGSHGKTTATAMISHVLTEARKNPTIFLGGKDKKFDNFIDGKSDFAVAEVCEYKKNLLDIPVKCALVLNIDNDHMDCYCDIKEMIETFRQFTKDSILVINADDENCQPLYHSSTLTFGINKKAHFMAKKIAYNGVGYSFTAYAYGKKLGRVNLKVMGKHNVYNALATIALTSIYNVEFYYQKKALENFSGVCRRCEFLGEVNDTEYYADYAHHPKEISATMTNFDKDNCLTIFQPHTYSRTKLLMQEFLDCLMKIKNLIIVDTYSAREVFDEEGSAKTLYENLVGLGKKDVDFVREYNNLKERLDFENDKFDKVLFLGAGDIYDMARKYLQERKNN